MPGLDAIDPLAIPLPAGTEVVARVEKRLGERVVKQGAVGRVVETGEAIVVDVFGVGRVSYARDELTPRKRGQWRFAVRREADWQALRPCVVLESVVGSRAWGLAHEGSDVDRRGVFVWPFAWSVALDEPPADLVSADGSATYWEIEKMLRQALRGDPNTLEMLFVDGAAAQDPIGEWILAARQAFVSQEIFGTFGRYAVAQLRKLDQAARLARHRTEVLAWLRDGEAGDLEGVAARLAMETGQELPRTREYVKQLYRSMYDQGLLAANDFASLRSFAVAQATDFELPRELRPKNAYNLIRLIVTARDWLRSGTPRLRCEGDVRDELLAIKTGQVPLDAVLARAEALVPELEAARDGSPLPRKADVGAADALLRRVREEIANRKDRPGPFGRDAAPLELARWEDDE